jgi:hypothetical protein
MSYSSGYEPQLEDLAPAGSAVLYQCPESGRFQPLNNLLWSSAQRALMAPEDTVTEIASIYCPVTLATFTAKQAADANNCSPQGYLCPTCETSLTAAEDDAGAVLILKCPFCKVRVSAIILRLFAI